ncbi:MAG: hypothetical protein KG003_12050 [Bacteroidetes bacterium]|nr:hypothetical protein [Bacteroidota bacterium]
MGDKEKLEKIRDEIRDVLEDADYEGNLTLIERNGEKGIKRVIRGTHREGKIINQEFSESKFEKYNLKKEKWQKFNCLITNTSLSKN